MHVITQIYHLQNTKFSPYMKIFEGYNPFHGQLVICKIFLLKILLAKLWLASIGEHGTLEKQHLILARANGMP